MMLKEIVSYKHAVLKEQMAEVSLRELKTRCENAGNTRGFKESIKRVNDGCLKIIAEIKQRSPSKGIISRRFDPKEIAKQYEESGAAAVSVLTEDKYFGGSLFHLKEAREACSIPLLRKDFIIHAYQVYEARAWGADAVLLIAGILTRSEINEFYNISRSLQMDVLLEVHSKQDVEKLADGSFDIIGVNNRSLNTFAVNFKNTERICSLLPSDIVKVSESGISTHSDIIRLESMGVDAALVGERLMRGSKPGDELRELLGERS